jgi:hypothetical protein
MFDVTNAAFQFPAVGDIGFDPITAGCGQRNAGALHNLYGGTHTCLISEDQMLELCIHAAYMS